MMKHQIMYLLLSGLTLCGLTACQDDNTFDKDEMAYSIYITYSEGSAAVTGDIEGLVTVSGADVTVNDPASNRALTLVLSGSVSDGSLLVYREKKFTIQLNGVSITNSDGPAINNQCGKALYVVCADGTTNTLADGTAYAAQSFDQKGALFSEGQIYFSGSGTLNVRGNCKNAIACDDYITIYDGVVINATTSSNGTNGIKANDGMYIYGGTLTVDVQSAGGRGIKCDSVVVINGGTTTITTSGDCVYDEEEDDYSSAACVKCDRPFIMTGGTLTMTSTGDGGKGLNCAEDIVFSGGTLTATTTGTNNDAKPKAVKGDGITILGGSFFAKVSKSWACDNGTDSDEPAAHVTVSGTPSATATVTVDGETYTSPYYSKKVMYIAY
ncbi:MAG: carbohydrate-binding domain-containing protein [Prevotella sp.]|nr:carbohydrate-binding domain-containing protein [Prevotella sp.]